MSSSNRAASAPGRAGDGPVMPAGRVRLGAIGLGIMGAPLVSHLQRAGHAMAVHTRTRARAAMCEAAGGRWCDSAADVASQSDVVFINVPDTPDVEAVLFGERGAALRLAPGSVVVDHSTISPEATRGFSDRLARQGVALLDAPVTGGEAGAKAGTLTIMVGGDAAAFERVRPLLAIYGKTILHVGACGAGQTLKACNQILVAVNMIGVCEALLLAERAGLDVQRVHETLGGGSGGSWAWSVLGAKILAGDFQPAFMIKLMQKDLRIVQEAAGPLGVPLPGVATAQQLFRAVEALPGGPELGTQALMLAFRRLAGENVRDATGAD